ncbi:hypothetical protein DIPPA_02813 [Diplonema papillatum]|nr:hypothetical protein DIPPA_02813 [Diplonema papillatum]
MSVFDQVRVMLRARGQPPDDESPPCISNDHPEAVSVLEGRASPGDIPCIEAAVSLLELCSDAWTVRTLAVQCNLVGIITLILSTPGKESVQPQLLPRPCARYREVLLHLLQNLAANASIILDPLTEDGSSFDPDPDTTGGGGAGQGSLSAEDKQPFVPAVRETDIPRSDQGGEQLPAVVQRLVDCARGAGANGSELPVASSRRDLEPSGPEVCPALKKQGKQPGGLKGAGSDAKDVSVLDQLSAPELIHAVVALCFLAEDDRLVVIAALRFLLTATFPSSRLNPAWMQALETAYQSVAPAAVQLLGVPHCRALHAPLLAFAVQLMQQSAYLRVLLLTQNPGGSVPLAGKRKRDQQGEQQPQNVPRGKRCEAPCSNAVGTDEEEEGYRNSSRDASDAPAALSRAEDKQVLASPDAANARGTPPEASRFERSSDNQAPCAVPTALGISQDPSRVEENAGSEGGADDEPQVHVAEWVAFAFGSFREAVLVKHPPLEDAHLFDTQLKSCLNLLDILRQCGKLDAGAAEVAQQRLRVAEDMLAARFDTDSSEGWD